MNYNFKIICPWLYAITLITVWIYMSLFFKNTNIIFCRQWRPLKMVPQQLYLISLKSHRPSNRYFFLHKIIIFISKMLLILSERRSTKLILIKCGNKCFFWVQLLPSILKFHHHFCKAGETNWCTTWATCDHHSGSPCQETDEHYSYCPRCSRQNSLQARRS